MTLQTMGSYQEKNPSVPSRPRSNTTQGPPPRQPTPRPTAGLTIRPPRLQSGIASSEKFPELKYGDMVEEWVRTMSPIEKISVEKKTGNGQKGDLL